MEFSESNQRLRQSGDKMLDDMDEVDRLIEQNETERGVGIICLGSRSWLPTVSRVESFEE